MTHLGSQRVKENLIESTQLQSYHTQQSVIRLETLQDEDVSSPLGPDFSPFSEIEPTSSSSAGSDPGKDDNSSDKNSITSGQGSVESGKVSEDSSTV